MACVFADGTKANHITAIDINTYGCASAPVVRRLQVASEVMCAMECMQHPTCAYFNVDVIPGADKIMCSITDFNKLNLIESNYFSSHGTWYSLD